MTHRPPLWGLPDPDYQAEFYADVPFKRALAWLIDTVLITVLVALAVVFTAFIGIFFVGFLYLIIGFLFRTGSIAAWSATPGMRLAAIELRNARGERLSGGEAFAHTLGYSVSMAFVLPQVISMALMLSLPRGQGLSDLVLGTAMINRSA